MAAVKGVGVSLSVQDLTVFGIEPDPSIQNTDARLFADLADWRRIVDPHPQSFAVGGAPPSSLAELRQVVSISLQHGQIPSGHRSSCWGGLLDDLSELGIETDAETLKSLPLHLELTDELVERLVASSTGF
jgi:hypothetical protein